MMCMPITYIIYIISLYSQGLSVVFSTTLALPACPKSAPTKSHRSRKVLATTSITRAALPLRPHKVIYASGATNTSVGWGGCERNSMEFGYTDYRHIQTYSDRNKTRLTPAQEIFGDPVLPSDLPQIQTDFSRNASLWGHPVSWRSQRCDSPCKPGGMETLTVLLQLPRLRSSVLHPLSDFSWTAE